jgi:hypothetical protein
LGAKRIEHQQRPHSSSDSRQISGTKIAAARGRSHPQITQQRTMRKRLATQLRGAVSLGS